MQTSIVTLGQSYFMKLSKNAGKFTSKEGENRAQKTKPAE
jgi:hypothetical protein